MKTGFSLIGAALLLMCSHVRTLAFDCITNAFVTLEACVGATMTVNGVSVGYGGSLPIDVGSSCTTCPNDAKAIVTIDTSGCATPCQNNLGNAIKFTIYCNGDPVPHVTERTMPNCQYGCSNATWCAIASCIYTQVCAPALCLLSNVCCPQQPSMPLGVVETPPIIDQMILTEDMFKNGESLYAPGGILIWSGKPAPSEVYYPSADDADPQVSQTQTTRNQDAMVLTADMFQEGVVLHAPGGRIIWPLPQHPQ